MSPVDSGIRQAGIRVSGKFFSNGERRVLLRGVTYGPFRPGPDGLQYPAEHLQNDMGLMAASGINAIRTYSVPPDRLIRTAEEHGLSVLVGLPWEQHVAFLDTYAQQKSIVERMRQAVANCRDSGSVLGFTIGNEIPASIVRWYGPRRIARFLRHAYDAVKDVRPDSLVTYVNYPTTEYLQPHLSFLDFASFNVYLESPESYRAYLSRLQSLAGDKPLVLAEIGLDSRRNGLAVQSESLEWQIRSTFERGAAGAYVFSWTDEWFRGGAEIEDWDFGLTDRKRQPKPALASVASAFADLPVSGRIRRPPMAVVVCTYNGSRTIDRTLRGVRELDYPDFEIIVVDDGSTDNTAEIAARWNVRLIRTPNRGLSSARNTGWEAARGEIVAYLDDDAYPDRDWLSYIAEAFHASDVAAVGGPNIIPVGSSAIEQAIDASPGNPIHVLLSDEIAEHIPGCNMAIRRDALERIGGFDSRFRIAGDDVDVCWRLQEAGMHIGFHPGAAVFHRRRSTVKAFLKQQLNYGKAEALLERKWPQKYNRLGHLRWSGRIYSVALSFPRPFARSRVYYGVWGENAFQPEESPNLGRIASLLATPEWYLLILALASLTACGLLWAPLFMAAPLLIAALAVLLLRAIASTQSVSQKRPSASWRSFRIRILAVQLHLVQPLARLVGRLRLGLTPWRPRVPKEWWLPRIERKAIWSEQWRSQQHWLEELEAAVSFRGIPVHRCGPYSRCDLQALGGLFGFVQVHSTVEEHGNGRQLVHFKLTPVPTGSAIVMAASMVLLLVLAYLSASTAASILFALSLGATALLTLRDCATAWGTVSESVNTIAGRLEQAALVTRSTR